ncbi:MAG: DUF389 domain-containing protein [Spirochaetales bacterium]|nr:DUF389 domain-containing protein [Spirochaetales bacterium]
MAKDMVSKNNLENNDNKESKDLKDKTGIKKSKEKASVSKQDESDKLIQEIKEDREKCIKKTFFQFLTDPALKETRQKSAFGLGGLIDQYRLYKTQKGKLIEKYSAYETVVAGATDRVEYYVLLILSCLIATLGLYQNSPATIIGAMIVAPLMGPIFGFSAGMLWGSGRTIREALSTLLKGIILVLAVTSLLSAITPGIVVTDEMLGRTHPTLFDIFVAIFCGFIGAYSYVNNKVSSAIPGVAISVALMPPLCTVGIGIGLMRWDIALGAVMLFGINLTGISLAALIVFYLVRLHPQAENQEEFNKARLRALGQLVLTLVLLAIIAVPLVFFTIKAAKNNYQQEQILQIIKSDLDNNRIYSFRVLDQEPQHVEVILLGDYITAETLEGWKKKINERVNVLVELDVFVIQSLEDVQKGRNLIMPAYLKRP